MADWLLYTLPPLLVFGGASAFFVRARERAREHFRYVARRQRLAKVVGGQGLLYPRLVVPLEGAEVQISCLHGGKKRRTRTFAWVGCPDYPDLDLSLTPKPKRAGMLERWGHTEADTGHGDFDAAFWLETDDSDLAHAILDEELRLALLAVDPARRVQLKIGSTTAYRDGWMQFGEEEPRIDVSIAGIAKSPDDVEQVLNLARLAHERLRVGKHARLAA